MGADTVNAILTLVGIVIGGILAATPGIMALRQQRRKLGADTMETIQDTLDKAIDLNQKLQVRMDAVEQRTVILLADNRAKDTRLTELERINHQVVLENKRLERYVKLLIAEIQRCNGTVPAMPVLEE
jgi:hypothetical protein